MVTFIAQCKFTGKTHEFLAAGIIEAGQYIDQYIGEKQDYIIHMSNIEKQEAAEIAAFRERIEFNYQQEIKAFRNGTYA